MGLSKFSASESTHRKPLAAAARIPQGARHLAPLLTIKTTALLSKVGISFSIDISTHVRCRDTGLYSAQSGSLPRSLRHDQSRRAPSPVGYIRQRGLVACPSAYTDHRCVIPTASCPHQTHPEDVHSYQKLHDILDRPRIRLSFSESHTSKPISPRPLAFRLKRSVPYKTIVDIAVQSGSLATIQRP